MFTIYRIASLRPANSVDDLKETYPDLETIFVDQHIPLHNLTMSCDERLTALLPGDGTMIEDLVKFRELFTF